MRKYRDEYKTAEADEEALTNMLALEDSDTRQRAADAELRLREHRAILEQATSAHRAACAAERQADAAEKAAAATERGANATVRYVRLTFGLLVFTAIAAIATLVGAFFG